ncbi:hypothetical protein BJ166DRAFT_626504 [Pestalotiopsis sp. NC0098]|nr:hypothetical protein BJ166DRAFT_626504 [Pestalotiopsis sp. NC0098]
MNSDGCGKTFRVSCQTHFALVLRLLGSFQATNRRVVLFPSGDHEAGKNPLEKIPPPGSRPMTPVRDAARRATGEAARRATGEAKPGERKYFALLKSELGSKDSQDEAAQETLWSKSAQ